MEYQLKNIKKKKQAERYKKNPFLAKVLVDELTKYNITQPPFSNGNSATVWRLPNNRVFHASIRSHSENEMNAHIKTIKNVTEALKSYNFLPRYETIWGRYNDGYSLIISIMEYFDVVPWRAYKKQKIYDSPKDLVDAIFFFFFQLFKAKVYLNDINEGNVVLTRQGIRMIDFDETCLPNYYDKFCKHPQTSTTTYTSPELWYYFNVTHTDKKSSAPPHDHAKFFKKEYGFDVKTIPEIDASSAAKVKTNMMYGAGALAYWTLTTNNNYKDETISLDSIPLEVRDRIRNALHPEAKKRQLQVSTEFFTASTSDEDLAKSINVLKSYCSKKMSVNPEAKGPPVPHAPVPVILVYSSKSKNRDDDDDENDKDYNPDDDDDEEDKEEYEKDGKFEDFELRGDFNFDAPKKRKTPVKKTSVKKRNPAKKRSSTKRSPAKKTPTKRSPAKKTPTKRRGSGKRSPAKRKK